MKSLADRIHDMDQAYFNAGCEDTVEDEEYDKWRELYDEEQTEKKQDVGALPLSTNRKSLPCYMASLNKIKDEHIFRDWKTGHEVFVIEPKLDGVSALYAFNTHLYTRGNGTIGSDISALLPHLCLPRVPETVCVRGELIMNKTLFQEKYATRFKNIRNLVAGVVNRKIPDGDVLTDIVFVAYEITTGPKRTPTEQIKLLESWGFETVSYQLQENASLTTDWLGQVLEDWSRALAYPIDGVVVCKEKTYPRKKDGNPDHAIAFKKNTSSRFVRVRQVLWTVSKNNVLKPRVEIFPVECNGVEVSRLTGFHARYIRDQGIGPGAILEITRSGEVIPHILRVVQPVQPQLPDRTFSWNATGVDIVLEDPDSKEQFIKKLVFFCKTMDIKNLSDKKIEKCVSRGCNSLAQFLKYTEQGFRDMGFGPVESRNMYLSVKEKCQNASLDVLMTASGFFGQGIGLQKIRSLIREIPDLLTNTNLMDDIPRIRGWTPKSASRFVSSLQEFQRFLEETRDHILIRHHLASSTDKPCIVLSGFRDTSLGDRFTIQETLTKDTRYLVVKDKSQQTSKTKKANHWGIPIVSVSELSSL